jgi:hypothetical protein
MARPPSITNTPPGIIAKRQSTTSQVTTKQQHITPTLLRGIFITPHTMPLKRPSLTSNITDRSLKPPVTRLRSREGTDRNRNEDGTGCGLLFVPSNYCRTFTCMLVAIPSPVRGITISSDAITRCSAPRTKVTATSSPRAGHADVSPAPSLRA